MTGSAARLNSERTVHLMGIAGAGMSALAELLVRRGVSITGCDSAEGAVPDLARLGIEVLHGHDAAHVDGVDEVIVTSAVPRDHPELERARHLGIPVTRRAEALGREVSGGVLVAIAGTHGKTTTTVLTTEALAAAGREPTGIAGGRVGAWGGNLRAGNDNVFVVEADEYDRSFHALTPTIAVITNVEADHLDIYPGGIREIRKAFSEFARPAQKIVLCWDDPEARALPTPASAEVISYGIDAADARLVATGVEARDGGSFFRVTLDGVPLGDLSLRVPGLHNVRNALAAIAAGIATGVSFDEMRPGLESFTGVERRFQRIGDAEGATIIDDYAHHPTEIIATIAAARAAFPGRRVVAAFQPHLYTRTRDFHREFAVALSAADVVYLCDIYPAREKPIEGVSSALIGWPMREMGVPPAWEGPRADLAKALADSLKEGDVILTLGAGDITRTAAELLELLEARKKG
jgi:UDP-N-acetylmuramate--alanine ligase